MSLKIVVHDERMFLNETNNKEKAGFLKIVYFWLIVGRGNSKQKMKNGNKISLKGMIQCF